MVRPAAHLRSAIDQDGTVILDIERDTLATLNATGGYVWGRLQQGELVDDIVRELAADTNTEIAVVDHDVRVFIDQLMSKRLVTD
jgi:hypothetical protein